MKSGSFHEVVSMSFWVITKYRSFERKTNECLFCRYVRTQMFRSDRGDRPNVPNYLVVLTDGKSNNQEQTWLEAMRARDQGIITTIGIGGGMEQNYMSFNILKAQEIVGTSRNNIVPYSSGFV